MKAKNKIRLVVAAYYGSALFDNSAFASSDSSSYQKSSSNHFYSSSLFDLDDFDSSKLVIDDPETVDRGDPKILSIVQDPPHRHQRSAPPERSECPSSNPFDLVGPGPGSSKLVMDDLEMVDRGDPKILSFVQPPPHRRRAKRRRQCSAPPERSECPELPLGVRHCPSHPDSQLAERRDTITGLFNEFDGQKISTRRLEQNLAREIKSLITYYVTNAMSIFVQFVTKGCEEALNKYQNNPEDAMADLLKLRLMNEQTFRYVVQQSSRPSHEALALYQHAGQCVQGNDGVINKIKFKVMNRILSIVRMLYPDIPEEVVEQLEEYIDSLLIPLGDALVDVVFELLEDDAFAPAGCCGCCKKLSKKDRRRIALGAAQMVGAVLGRIFGQGFEDGVNLVARGICGAVQRSPSNYE
jgi:hypothetical protein